MSKQEFVPQFFVPNHTSWNSRETLSEQIDIKLLNIRKFQQKTILTPKCRAVRTNSLEAQQKLRQNRYVKFTIIMYGINEQ